MSRSNPGQLGDHIADALGKIGLSMAALIAMTVFFGAAEEFGWPQLLGLLALHGIALWLLAKALQSGNVNLAIGALLLGIAWNLGVVVCLIAAAPTNIYGEMKFDTKSGAGALLLAWWYWTSIRKLRERQG
jgi:hypothetical protein